MSYNLSSTEIILLKDFEIPMKEIYNAVGMKGTIILGRGSVEFSLGGESVINGNMQQLPGADPYDNDMEQWVRVEQVEIFGDGSGNMWGEYEKIFKKGRGTMALRLIWEGGDTVEERIFKDGVVEDYEPDCEKTIQLKLRIGELFHKFGQNKELQDNIEKEIDKIFIKDESMIE